MPEYLAPGVYIEEVSFRSKSIEGVSTTTTGFVGPTRYGPTDLEPEIITSLAAFEQVYGDRQQLKFGTSDTALNAHHNYMWHAVRGFFENGGRRLYVSRVFNPRGGSDDGRAHGSLGSGANPITFKARFPGAAGKLRVTVSASLGQNVFGPAPGNGGDGQVVALLERDVVWISDVQSPVTSPPGGGNLYLVARDAQGWAFRNGATTLHVSDLQPADDQVRVVTLSVAVTHDDPEQLPAVWSELPPDPAHERAGARDGFAERFAEEPANRALKRSLPIVVELGTGLTDGLQVLSALFGTSNLLNTWDTAGAITDEGRLDALARTYSVNVTLDGGNDGQRPDAGAYEGEYLAAKKVKIGLLAFEDLEDISIVAAPGATYGLENGYRSDAMTITSLLISHAERMRYRIAVLDSGDGQSVGQVRALRARFDSKHAALYYPWVRVLDPVTRREINLPPSGFVAGIYARNDTERAVYKAPANEVVSLAIGFEAMLSKGEQEVLNPEGVNCFRFFEGRGLRLWGARTISSDPEWKYVNLRRYFAYLERSIDRGTQWAVFEPNGEALWGNVRRTIEDFMLNEWMNGALLGDRPEKAFFVKCDRSTMSQNDLDNGRLVCLIGVGALRPAEFVIFRIGQWTADRKV
jgi:uncharacterized protein